MKSERHRPSARSIASPTAWQSARGWLTAAILITAGLAAACRAGAPEDEGADGASPGEAHVHEGAAGMAAMAPDSPGPPSGEVLRQAVRLTGAQERALGVVYLTVGRRPLERTIRTVGRIEAAEPRVADVTPKIEGFVEHLFVGTTGEAVRRGQPLLTLYSPQLVAAQEELLTAQRLAGRVEESVGEASEGARTMLQAARRRLGYWDITEEQIERLERTGEVTKTLTLVSPVSGIVLEKHVLQGQKVMPGQLLYRLADLSEVWVEGDVFERDLKFLVEGARSHIEVAAYPGEHLMGRVSFIYPTVDVASRTNRVRVTLANPDLRLKPGMFATLFFDARVSGDAVAIPMEAVLVTGERNLVFVRDETGTLQPREVVLGAQAENFVEILAGLGPGETIVGSANFLIDAESRLAVTGGGMPGMQHTGHGSVIEPENGDQETPSAPEHRHD